MKQIALITLMCLALPACTLYQIDANSGGVPGHYPSKGSTQEIVYLERTSKSYDVIGEVTINAERNQSMEEILLKMKEEAAWLGGEAITNMKTDGGTGRWARYKPELFKNAHVRANFRADVIVFK